MEKTYSTICLQNDLKVTRNSTILSNSKLILSRIIVTTKAKFCIVVTVIATKAKFPHGAQARSRNEARNGTFMTAWPPATGRGLRYMDPWPNYPLKAVLGKFPITLLFPEWTRSQVQIPTTERGHRSDLRPYYHYHPGAALERMRTFMHRLRLPRWDLQAIELVKLSVL